MASILKGRHTERPPFLFVTDMLHLPFDSVLDVVKKRVQNQHQPPFTSLCIENVA